MDIKNEQTLSMESFSTLKNLCDWDIYFALVDGGDKKIKKNGTLDLLNREIISLCNNNNVFFTGDGQGNHARIFIENELVRKYVGFDGEDGKRKQKVLDDERCEYILNLKTKKAFEDNVISNITGYHEKVRIVNYAKKIKLNDYEKIKFLEEYCGQKF